MLKPGGQVDGDEALEFYAKHTAQIEVNQQVKPWTGGGGGAWTFGGSTLYQGWHVLTVLSNKHGGVLPVYEVPLLGTGFPVMAKRIMITA